MKVKVITKLACDFCGKTQDEVAALICGPKDVCICNECIKVAVGVIDKNHPEMKSEVTA